MIEHLKDIQLEHSMIKEAPLADYRLFRRHKGFRRIMMESWQAFRPIIPYV